ncbi:MAG: class I SAM-dependent methyltransferase [Azospirillaceae bacterium]
MTIDQPPFTFRDRLKAWWEGIELPRAGRAGAGGQGQGAGAAGNAAGDARAARRAAVAEREDRGWKPDRIELLERLWGQGYHGPGLRDQIPTLVRPLALDETMSVLEVGAGLGGAARFMAESYGSWVTGLESDPELATEGMRASAAAGLEKRAAIKLFDPEQAVVDQRYDAIFAKEAFFTVARKNELIEALAGGLKPRGQFLFTDYVLSHSASSGAVLDAWYGGEPSPPHPWTVTQVVERLKRMGLDLRVSEDISPLHRRQILAAWEGLLAGLPPDGIARAARPLLLEQVELWMRRVAAIDSGDLRVYRFLALAPGDV